MSQVARVDTPRRSVTGLTIALVILLLAVVLYFPVLQGLIRQWSDDSNYRHGFLVPIISAILLYRRREELRSAKPGGGTILGILFLGAAAVFLIGGTAATELMTARLSVPTFLIGISFFFAGKEFTRRAAFPLLFLYMMVPLPYIIYYKIAFPLQLFSARVSAAILDTLGVSVVRQGNVLHLPEYVLEVVAACSGLRSLMTMVTLALIIGVFGDLSIRNRTLLVAIAIPAAIIANTVRLVVTGFGAYLISTSFADGFLHEFSGMLIFFSGSIVLMLAFLLLRRIQ